MPHRSRSRPPADMTWAFGRMGLAMLLRSIRSRLLALVLAAVLPFVALVGAGLWSQWREDEAAAVERALNEARPLAAHIDNHPSHFENLLVRVSLAGCIQSASTRAHAVSLRPP